ncbi:ABC transporter permease [Bacillus sp. FSL R12-0069]|uniref:ABC transporter permease n=1 Tax=Bacillus sp. FSL R12-0069 TaxID=2975342 RepID=UPI0030F8D193
MNRVKVELKFLKALFFVNLSSNMEYRFNFILQVIFMCINNLVYIIFWKLFFGNFNNINGWNMSDMYLLFSIVTTGFGIGMVVCGNSTQLANIISMGKLDSYLILPKNVLLHVLCSRMSIKAVGDVIFGVLIFAVSGVSDVTSIGIWILSIICVAIIFVSFTTLFGTLAFWIGKANIIQQQVNNALLTFALYPQTIYKGFSKFIIFTIMPAGIIGFIPVELIKEFDLTKLLSLIGFCIFIAYISTSIFRLGLKKYESNNIFTFRD